MSRRSRDLLRMSVGWWPLLALSLRPLRVSSLHAQHGERREVLDSLRGSLGLSLALEERQAGSPRVLRSLRGRLGASVELEERQAGSARMLDSLRSQIEMQGSIAAAFRRLESSGDASISAEELQHHCKKRFSIDMDDATKTIALFTKDGENSSNLFDMQCMWYELEVAACQRRLNSLGRALKQYTAVRCP